MADNATVFDPPYVHMYDWTKHSVSIFTGLSFLLGVPGNILVVLVHLRIHVKSVTDWMVFYIAICDIMSLINAPLYIFQYENNWTMGFPDFLCKYHFFNLHSVSMASYLFSACMAIERFYKVVASKDIFSMTLTRCIWIPIVGVSFGIGSLTIFVVSNNINGHCMFDISEPYIAYISTIEHVMLTSVAFGTTLIMITCYVRIGVYLIMKMKEINESGTSGNFSKSYRNTIQTTKMLAVVTCVFLFSANTPYITGLAMVIEVPTEDPALSLACVLTMTFFVNNFFNPFLYMGMSASFRKRTNALFETCRGSINTEPNETTFTELQNSGTEKE